MSARRHWRTFTRDLLRSRNYDLVRFTRMDILRHAQVDMLLDVGANVGQFAHQVRRLGYSGDIVSFEPLRKPRRDLENAARKDDRWEVAPYALGDEDGTASINVTANTVSSSLLVQERLLTQVDPSSEVVSHEEIEVRRLDSVYADLVPTAATVALKIDTQGYERQVLLGATESLHNVQVVHFETSLVPLYQGELLLPEALALMDDLGFRLASLEPGLPDSRTGQLLQVDVTMVQARSRPLGDV